MTEEKDIDPVAAELIGLTPKVDPGLSIPERTHPLDYVAQRLSLFETEALIQKRKEIVASFLAGNEPVDLRQPGVVGNELNALIRDYHIMGQQLVDNLPSIPGIDTDPEAMDERKRKSRLALNILLARMYSEAQRTDDLKDALNDALDETYGLEQYAQEHTPGFAIEGVYEALDSLLRQLGDE